MTGLGVASQRIAFMKSTFFEIVLRSLTEEERRHGFADGMRASTVVCIQNVADYLFGSEQDYWDGSEQDYWDVTVDFPNIAPPWPEAWFEYVDPVGARVGILYWAKTLDELRGQGKDLEEHPAGARWFVGMDVWRQLPPGASLRVGRVFNWVDAAGAAVQPEPGAGAYLEPFHGAQPAGIIFSTYPVLLALSFAHCKNVELAEEVRELRAKAARELKLPRVIVRTLLIEPMRRVVEEARATAGDGSLKKALHIVRGHFKNYRGRGLFGKHQGLYWWDQAVRGSLDKGVVIKDYDVKPPRPGG